VERGKLSRPGRGGADMDLELHQLDLRYESLRVLNPRRERRLLASISEAGQLVPICVIAQDESRRDEVQRYVVLDGFARVRVVRRLRRDTVRAVLWGVSELDALLLARSLRSSQPESTLEQAWLLAELAHRFDLDQQELARRFDRSPSWVSRRLALIRELPQSVHEEIRRGRIVAHAAEKYLVPVARANREDGERLARAIAGEELSTRDIAMLYGGWRDGSRVTRERLIEDPKLFLRVRRSAEAASPVPEEIELAEMLLKESRVIGAAIGRARRRLRQSDDGELKAADIEGLSGSYRAVFGEISKLINDLKSHEKDDCDAGSE
jgi:ParB family transcriptional regulator, chromosome partitioning protein